MSAVVIYRLSTDTSAEKLHELAAKLEIPMYYADLHTDSEEFIKTHSIDSSKPTLINLQTDKKYAVGVDAILALTDEQITQIKTDKIAADADIAAAPK